MADFESKYTGEEVEQFLDQIANGEGGGITTETDPIFSASPAASITEAKKTEWDAKQEKITDLDAIRSGAEKGATALQSVPPEYVTETELNNKGYATTSALNNKVDKVSGKQLSTQDFTTELEGKLKGIEANAQKNVQSDWSESDTDSDTYVNNRTHYSYDIEQVTSFSIASKNQGDILVTGLHDGVFYRIINYAGGKNEAFHFVEGRKVVIPSNGPTIEAVCAYEDDFCLKLTTTTYGMTESFILKEIYVEQLDDVYVPETIARKAEIATINGQSLTEGGDITIQGGAVADNVYITDFTIADLDAVYSGEVEQLQIDGQGLKDALNNRKNILVHSGDSVIGGYGILLGEAVDNEIYFTVYTHGASAYNVEVYDDIIMRGALFFGDLTAETVKATNVGDMTYVAVANGLMSTIEGRFYALPDAATGDENAVLLTTDKIKSVGGKSLLISDEEDTDIPIALALKGASSSEVTLERDTLIECGQVRDSLHLIIPEYNQGYAHECAVVFYVAEDDCELTLSDNIRWADGVVPAMTKGKTYEISFRDNYATFLEF